MTFLHPEFIFMMLPLLIILFGMFLTQREIQEAFFSIEILQRLQVDSDQLSTKVRNVFFFLMFLFMIIALAAPVVEQGYIEVESPNDTLYVVIELSEGVEERTVYLKEQLQKLSKTALALVTYDSESYLIAPPTHDYNYLETRLDEIAPGMNTHDIHTLYKAMEKIFTSDKSKNILMIVSPKNALKIEQLDTKALKIDQVMIASNRQQIVKAMESFEEGVKPTQKPIYVHLFVIFIGLSMLMLIIASSSFYKGEKYHLPVLLLSLFIVEPMEIKADFLDYRALNKASALYQEGKYRESAKVYEKYALNNESKEALYNAANAYYKSGAYRRAVGLYQSIHFRTNEANRWLYFNLANALIRLDDVSSLQAAVTAYKRSLSFGVMSEAEENLQQLQAYLRKYKASQQANSTYRMKKKYSYEKLDSIAVEKQPKILEKIPNSMIQKSRGHRYKISF